MNNFALFFVLSSIALGGAARATLLTEEQIGMIQGTHPYPETVELAIEEAEKGTGSGHFLEGYSIEHQYKNQAASSLVVMTSFGGNEKKGELALYPANTDLSRIALKHVDYFSDTHPTAAKPMTTLGFKYVPALEDNEAYWIVERVDTFPQYTGRGLAQRALSCFLDLVTQESDVRLVVADCRARESRHFFAKLGFKEGADAFVQDKEHFLLPYAWRPDNASKEKI